MDDVAWDVDALRNDNSIRVHSLEPVRMLSMQSKLSKLR